MNYRVNTKVIILVVGLVALAAALFVYTLVSAPTEIVVENTPNRQNQDANTNTPERLLTAKHQYKEGTHALAGTAEVPTPCHRLITEPFITNTEGTSTEAITEVEIRFSTLLEGEACPNELFDAPFFVSFDGPEDITIQATWNGDPLRLNLIPVGPDEVLHNEVYIKG